MAPTYALGAVYRRALGQGLVEGYALSGRGQSVAHGVHLGRGVIGNQTAEIGDDNAVVVPEQGADVVGELHWAKVR